MHIDVPHFNLPFSFKSSLHSDAVVVDVVEQDSIDDIANCVEAILRTHVGERDDLPLFGSPDLAFMKVPLGEEMLTEIITSQEPRATVLIEESQDRFNELITNIEVSVFPTGGEG